MPFDPQAELARAESGSPQGGQEMMRMPGIATAFALMVCASAFGRQAQAPEEKTNTTPTQAEVSSREALIARAKSLELDTRYAPPPGDPLEHHTAGYAK